MPFETGFGNPVVPTAGTSSASNQAASTQFVSTAVSNFSTYIATAIASAIASAIGGITSYVKLINSTTLSGATAFVDTTSLTSTYFSYDVIIGNLSTSTGTSSIRMRLQSGGTFQTSNYVANFFFFNGSPATGSNSVSTYIPISNGTSNNIGTASSLGGTIRITNPSGSTSFSQCYGQSSYLTINTVNEGCMVAGFYNSVAAVTGLEIFASTGTVSGTFEVYGYT